MKVPHISTIEFTNACNFSCSYCQRYHEVGKRPIGMLDINLVKLMVQNGDFENTMFCEFQQNGEPTIHPKFEEIARLIKSVVPMIGMSTNGTFHKFKHFQGKKIDYLDTVTISIHSETTEEDIDKTIAMLENCKIRIQTLDKYIYDLNIEKYRNVDGIFIDNYDIRDFDKIYKSPKFCLDVISSCTIQWDGTLCLAAIQLVNKKFMVIYSITHFKIFGQVLIRECLIFVIHAIHHLRSLRDLIFYQTL